MLAGKQNVMLFGTDTKHFLINLVCSVSVEVQHATLTPMRKPKRQGSCESSDREVTYILPRKYIFCNAEKYLKGCQMCEKLSKCIEIRANKKFVNWLLNKLIAL